MSKIKLYESIISKAFQEHTKPFSLPAEAQYEWSGNTRVKRKSTGQVYDVNVEFHLNGNKRLQRDVSTCLCKTEGVRFDDLRIVTMLDTKLDGGIEITGLPGPNRDVKLTFKKFLQTYEKESTES